MTDATLFSTFFRRKRGASFLDRHWCAGLNQIEKFNEIGIPHPNTAVTGSFTNLVFVIGPVDINEAITRVRVVRFKAIEPEYARQHQIIVRRVLALKTERLTALEDCT